MGIEDLIAWIETSVNGSTDTDRLAPPLTSDQPRSGGMHHTRSGLRRGSDCLFPGFLTLACRDLPSEKARHLGTRRGLEGSTFYYLWLWLWLQYLEAVSLSLSLSLLLLLAQYLHSILRRCLIYIHYTYISYSRT